MGGGEDGTRGQDERLGRLQVPRGGDEPEARR